MSSHLRCESLRVSFCSMFFDGVKRRIEVQAWCMGMHVSVTAPLNGNNGPGSSLVEMTIDEFKEATITR